MELKFDRKPKKAMVGVRVTNEEYKNIKIFAKKYKVSCSEICRVLISTMMDKINE